MVWFLGPSETYAHCRERNTGPSLAEKQAAQGLLSWRESTSAVQDPSWYRSLWPSQAYAHCRERNKGPKEIPSLSKRSRRLAFVDRFHLALRGARVLPAGTNEAAAFQLLLDVRHVPGGSRRGEDAREQVGRDAQRVVQAG
jgi:hypothetical protein